ncbi:MAG TPA: GH116 family glycosyl hydrolase [Puia sp.]|jgi:uncharacterized protein (DUF608 family)
MKKNNQRRDFLKTLTLAGAGVAVSPVELLKAEQRESEKENVPGKKSTAQGKRAYNTPYTGEHLNRTAFPIGGLGAGMFCLEGTGAISHMSVRNRPDIYHEPAIFSAITVKGIARGAKVLEGLVPDWKYFGKRGSGLGSPGDTYGLPRFSRASFAAKFPFATIELEDDDLPLTAEIKGWSPFIPTDEDNSGLPAGALEYTFVNKGATKVDAVFSWSSKNFMVTDGKAANSIRPIANGFVLEQAATAEKPSLKGSFAVFTDDAGTVVDHCWFRGGWWDPFTMAWNAVRDGELRSREAVANGAPGASLFVPFTLASGAKKTIRLMLAWYVPDSELRIGEVVPKENCDVASGCCSGPEQLGVPIGKKSSSQFHKPWYSSRFDDVYAVADHWRNNYTGLQQKTKLFTDAFYTSSLPPEVVEAVGANLTILKSPTVMRQYDGRLWNWEGCGDDEGSCHGSCTHVWNYAQATAHLFPALERTLRNTEFCENQNKEGHQGFRANMPISPLKHDFHAASDGQLGGIMKVYREWRISGDSVWLSKIFPMVRTSMDYCIRTWDPKGKGVVEEPHHNTYDIEFWGPDPMITSFYLGALKAMTEMGGYLKQDIGKYRGLYAKGKSYLETTLYNGEFFFQDITYQGLNAPDPAKAQSFGGEYSAEAIAILKKEGPKYQYGKGCLSDGVLGAWIGLMCGLDDFIDAGKLRSHLLSVHKYNLKADLSEHANPQRPGYALGHEGGLLLCSWPKGGRLSLPFVYSDEVWTGIEYQVASHLMAMGRVQEGLEIVRHCRNRYDGRIRNPFNEYECGHWYGRALSSYGMLQGLTGVRYDAVDKTLFVHSAVGDFTSFLSTAGGFGTVSCTGGKISMKTVYGKIEVDKVMVGGKESKLI